MKVLGQLKDAQLENRTSDPSNLPDGRMWIRTDTDRAKFYDGAATREITTNDQTQTLTNKTLTAPAISSPTGLVKADVGLGNVDNTSDASKPISTATQAALDAKQDLDATLTALAAFNSDGILTQTAANTFAARTISAGSNKISISNGNGVAGNPTVDVAEANLTLGNLGGTLSVAKGGTGQTSYTDGQLLIGNSSGNTLTKATITAGTGIGVSNGNGSITISALGAGTAAKNYIINSNFDYWQRNTSFTTPSSGSYTADRFRVDYDGTIGTFTLSRQAFTVGQTDVPNEPTYFARWNQTAAGSGSTFRHLRQRIQSVRSLAGKSVSVSVWMKADSARTVDVGMTQNFGTGGSPSSDVAIAAQSASVTTTWTKFSFTFAVPSISGKTLGSTRDGYLQLYFSLPVNTTMTLDFAQVMTNEGTSVSDWQYASGGTALTSHELWLCQKHYEKTYPLDTAPGSTSGDISNAILRMYTTENVIIGHEFMVEKIFVPTVTYWSYWNNTQGAWTRISNNQDSPVTVQTTSTKGNYNINISAQANPGGSAGAHYTAEAEL